MQQSKCEEVLTRCRVFAVGVATAASAGGNLSRTASTASTHSGNVLF